MKTSDMLDLIAVVLATAIPKVNRRPPARVGVRLNEELGLAATTTRGTMPHQRKPTLGRYGRTWHDQKAPDGFTVNGWRKVCRGGYVRFQQGKHFHPDLEKWAGMWVFVELADCWGINAIVWPDEPWKDHRTRVFCANERDWQRDENAILRREMAREAV